jgi:hypothetical protein
MFGNRSKNNIFKLFNIYFKHRNLLMSRSTPFYQIEDMILFHSISGKSLFLYCISKKRSYYIISLLICIVFKWCMMKLFNFCQTLLNFLFRILFPYHSPGLLQKYSSKRLKKPNTFRLKALFQRKKKWIEENILQSI